MLTNGAAETQIKSLRENFDFSHVRWDGGDESGVVDGDGKKKEAEEEKTLKE